MGLGKLILDAIFESYLARMVIEQCLGIAYLSLW